MLSPVAPCVAASVGEEDSGIVGVLLEIASGTEVDSGGVSLAGSESIGDEMGRRLEGAEIGRRPDEAEMGRRPDEAEIGRRPEEAEPSIMLELLPRGNGGPSEVEAPAEDMEAIGVSMLELIIPSLVGVIMSSLSTDDMPGLLDDTGVDADEIEIKVLPFPSVVVTATGEVIAEESEI